MMISSAVHSSVLVEPRPPRYLPAPPESSCERERLDDPGVAALVDLDRDGAAVAVDAVAGVVAVGEGTPTPARDHEVVADVELVVLRVVPAEEEVAVGAGVGRERALRQAAGHRRDHRVADAHVGLRVAAHLRGREVHVHHRRRPRQHADRPVATGVARDRRVGQVQHGVVGGGAGDAEGGVDRALGLPVRAAEVGDDLVALHHHVDGDAIGRRVDPVVFHVVFEGVGAIGGSPRSPPASGPRSSP